MLTRSQKHLLVSMAVAIIVMVAGCNTNNPTNPTISSTPIYINGDFENGSSTMPDFWMTGEWTPGSFFSWEQNAGLNGSRAISIESPSSNDAHWQQTLQVTPRQYYTLRGYVKGENIVSTQDGNIGANICLVGTWFYAGDRLFGTFDWQEVLLRFQAPASGEITIGCRLGFWYNTAVGKAYFDDISLTPGFGGLDHRVGKHVELALEPQDTAAFTGNRFQHWLDHLDDAYDAYVELVGSAPYQGERILILSVDSYPGGWAVAGNPILWYQPYIQDELRRCNDNDDWSFGILHELGHDFDIGGWNWDAEWWANMKMYYVVEQLQAKVLLDDRYYIGAELEQFYKTDSSESYDNTMAQGRYGGGGLHYCLIRIKHQIGWEPFKQTFRYYVNSGVQPASNRDNFNHFLDKLTEYSHYDVRATFLPGELQIIENAL